MSDDDEVRDWQPDPWFGSGGGPWQLPAAISSSAHRTRPQGVFMQSVTAPSHEPPAQRIIHDVPPVWDGAKPETDLHRKRNEA